MKSRGPGALWWEPPPELIELLNEGQAELAARVRRRRLAAARKAKRTRAKK